MSRRVLQVLQVLWMQRLLRLLRRLLRLLRGRAGSCGGRHALLMISVCLASARISSCVSRRYSMTPLVFPSSLRRCSRAWLGLGLGLE